MSLLHLTSRAVAGISAASDKDELRAALYAAVQSLGFDSFNIAFEKSDKREFMTEPTLTIWSYDDLVAYAGDGWGERDPLLDYAATGTDPLYWQAPSWNQNGHPDYYEYIKHVGVFGGLTVPLAGSPDKLGALTLLSLADRKHDKDVTHAVSIVAMMAKARAAAVGLVSGQESGASAKFRALSSLQREILKWMANGKSNVEIALIVAQSKRSIDYHVIEILKKLEVSSRAQAAAIYASL